jgi:hypothetical protein
MGKNLEKYFTQVDFILRKSARSAYVRRFGGQVCGKKCRLISRKKIYFLNRRNVPIGKFLPFFDARKNSPYSGPLISKWVVTTFNPTMADNPTAYMERIKNESFFSSN